MEEKKAKMLKFIMGKGHQPSAERLKVQKELFGFSRSVRHGFPSKPTAMAWDPELKILAIGSKQGLLRVYGHPGVEFYGQHDSECLVRKILFLPGQGRLVTLTEDNHLHLWEINGTLLQKRFSTSMEGRLKQISQMCLDNQKVLLGTEGGNIYHLNLKNFVIEDTIIYQDLVIQHSTDEFKVNPGAVEALHILPQDDSKLLIGYARGLIVVWDRNEARAEKTFYANQQLESVSIKKDGSEFISAHNDGSYIMWSLTSSSTEPMEPPNTPYGPYPCKAITKIFWDMDTEGTTWTVFSGGMPRASYGDKSTVTVMKGEEKHSVFDLTSKIMDFALINDSEGPSVLLILGEEELVALDLKTDSWPSTFKLPYLNPIHASSITCVHFINQVKKEVFDKIKGDAISKISSKPWPITGGTAAEEPQEEAEDLLITGHEDGSVKFWACGTIAMSLLATIKTAKYFLCDDIDAPRDDDEEEEEDEWPPFKKVGQFDPYSDDARLAIRKVNFCPKTGQLQIGGTAGQVLLFKLASEAAEDADIPVIKSDLVTEKEGFTWKGHQALVVKADKFKMPVGFQPTSILTISPPASVNSLAFQDDYGILAIGTAHGLVILDTVQNVVALTKCTLNAQDIANADDNPMSRRKSLKKSLRESFRRLRKGRSQRNKKNTNTTTDPIKRELPRSDSPEARPVERAIEARNSSEDGLGSMVRCLYFAETFIANPTTTSPTLWAGTNSGQVLVFLLNIPAKNSEKRKEEKVSCVLGKTIHLKHGAPVISIQVLDAKGFPLVDCKDSPHKVLIASEEQFKIFLLPILKACGKYKLTAHEGAKIRKVGFTTFYSKADPGYSENCLTCLTNQGDLAIHSLPELRRQVIQTQCMKKEDMIGISTFVFTPKGEAFFQASSSELARVSMGAAICKQAKGTLVIAPNARHEINQGGEKKNESNKEKEAAEAAAVARQNQLNEQQAQGVKSPVTNGDPHNDTTVSDISADITLDSVRDHTMSQQQLMDTTLSSSTSKTSIKEPPKSSPIPEGSETKEDVVANGESEDLNGAIESLESTVITDHVTNLDNPDPCPDQKSETDNDETIIQDKTIDDHINDETVHEKTLEVHEKTIEVVSEENNVSNDDEEDDLKTNKTIEISENVEKSNEEKVTSVDEPMNPDTSVNSEDAPLASMESDPAPLASLDSNSTTTEMPSM